MSNFKMPTAYHPSNAEWVRHIESLTSDGVRELQRLKAENAKLREESSKHNDLYIHAIADAEVWHLQWSAEHQENEKLRELLQRLLAEYRYMSVRPRKVYMRHERRMRAIEEEMRELGIEVPD